MARKPMMTAYRMRRAGDMNTNPATFVQNTSVFAAAIGPKAHVTLLVKRSSEGIEGFLIAPTGSDREANALANTLGARAETVPLPELEASSVGYSRVPRKDIQVNESQSGIDPATLARALPNILVDGSWVAVTFRNASKTEIGRYREWMDYRVQANTVTHHTRGMNPLVTTFIAGSDDDGVTKSILNTVQRAMPGFDMLLDHKTPTPRSEAMPWWLASLAPVAVVAAWKYFFGSWTPLAFMLPVFAVLFGYGLAKHQGWVRTRWAKLWRAADETIFERPGKYRGVKYRKPKRAVTTPGQEKDGHPGDYPLADDCFMAGPSVIMGLIAPTAGALSGEKASRESSVPPAMLKRIGPYVGETVDGSAFLSAVDGGQGVAVLGRPGSGKTVLLRSLFGWSMLDKIQPDPTNGFPGRNNTLITFESKGDGVPVYRNWAQAVGDELMVVDVNRHDSYAIDMFDVPGTYTDRANFFVNAMVYAFEPGAIQDRSFTTLVHMFAAALAVDAGVIGNVANTPIDPDAGPMTYAYILLGGLGDTAATELMAAIIARGNELSKERDAYANAVTQGLYGTEDETARARAYIAHIDEFVEAAYGIRQYAERTESQRRGFTEAPLNKVAQLLGSAGKSWWSRSRPKVGWNEVLNSHRSVVINTGTSELGELVPDRLGQQLSSMMMFTLKDAIARTCSGWESQRRWVSVFSDELSLLAGNSPEVLTWLRDQGRSFGVRPYMATQRPAQLPEAVRRAFLNFATLISYAQDEPTTAEEVAGNISDGEDGWDANAILHLPPYTAVVRASVNKRRQSPFTVKVANFESAMGSFAAMQGYTGERHVSAEPSGYELPDVPTHDDDEQGLVDEPQYVEPTPTYRPSADGTPMAAGHPYPSQPSPDVQPSAERAPSPFADDEGYPILGDPYGGNDGR